MGKFWSFIAFGLYSTTILAMMSAQEEPYFAWERREWLWEKIEAQRSAYLPMPASTIWESLGQTTKTLLNLYQIFNTNPGEEPENHPETLFIQGSVAKVRLKAVENYYTGIFRGAYGIARFSLAADPRTIGSFTPALAIKFFTDDDYAPLYILVMEKYEGQGNNRNWFAKSFSNILPDPQSATMHVLGKVFSRTRNAPNQLSIKHLAEREVRDGRLCFEPKTPYQIIFRPTSEVKALIPANSREDFRINLAALTPGLTLYEIIATHEPGAFPMHIADLVLESEVIASSLGDEIFRGSH